MFQILWIGTPHDLLADILFVHVVAATFPAKTEDCGSVMFRKLDLVK
jgi:hypothetical protein